MYHLGNPRDFFGIEVAAGAKLLPKPASLCEAVTVDHAIDVHAGRFSRRFS
jgi:hypothetical protein